MWLPIHVEIIDNQCQQKGHWRGGILQGWGIPRKLVLWLPLASGHGPLTRYVKLRVAHAPGMPETFPRHRWISIPTCIAARASRTCCDAGRDRYYNMTVWHFGHCVTFWPCLCDISARLVWHFGPLVRNEGKRVSPYPHINHWRRL